MRYFTVPDESANYFYRPNIGVCKKGMFSAMEPEVIVQGGIDGFGVLRDSGTHIICANENNEIIYIKDNREPVGILTVKEGVRPYDFTVMSSDGLPDLFYKVEYDGDILLLRFTVGGSKNPVRVAKLSPEHTEYAAGDEKVFYTNTENVLGYSDVSLGGTGGFVPLCKGGYMPYYAELAGNKYLVYLDGNSIFINGEAVVSDKHALSPVLFRVNDTVYLQWLSGCFVRYMTNSDGVHWSAPMRYIGNGEAPEMITFVTGNGKTSCYGYKGKPFTPGVTAETDNFIRNELGEIQKQVSVLKNEFKKISSVNYFDKN